MLSENQRRAQDLYVLAIQSGDLSGLKNCLGENSKKEINTPVGKLGLTLLHLAAVFGQVEISRWLLQNGAKPQKKENFSGKTPLHLAAYYGHSDLIQLLQAHTKLYTPDNARCFPIHYACMGGHVDLVKKHFVIKGLCNGVSEVGSPLDIAIRMRNLPLADFLSSNIGVTCVEPEDILEDFEETLRRTDGLSPIHLALSMGEIEIAKMLLEKFPQFPSASLKNHWGVYEVNSRFFATRGRERYLELFFSSDEREGFVGESNDTVKSDSLIDPKQKIKLEICRAILNDQMDKIKEIVSHVGLETLTSPIDNSWHAKFSYAVYTPFSFAVDRCYFPLMEWLISKRAFLESDTKNGFFHSWSFMEYEQNAGGFFQLLASELEILTRKNYVAER